MYNCIFTGQCTDGYRCNPSCPILAQTSYLLERNDIKMTNPVFKLSKEYIDKCYDILDQSKGRIGTAIVSSGDFTNKAADALTYCAIAENWKGSQLHCTVYNLNLSQYIDLVWGTWSHDTESVAKLDQVNTWIKSAKVLIISNIDFMNFKDSQSREFLTLLQSRMSSECTTIVVSPPISSLVGDGQFFSKLTSILTRQKVGEGL